MNTNVNHYNNLIITIQTHLESETLDKNNKKNQTNNLNINNVSKSSKSSRKVKNTSKYYNNKSLHYYIFN